jgi:predicted nucleotidyltransferase/predicted RNase H-like HicB family nuclease
LKESRADHLLTVDEIRTEARRAMTKTGRRGKVILFGSYARGDARVPSDVDLMVVVESYRRDKIKDYGEIRRSIDHGRGIDLIVAIEAEHEEWKTERGSVHHEAFTHGVVLFDDRDRPPYDLTEEDGTWTTHDPAIPGVYGMGPSRETALADLAEAQALLVDYEADKLDEDAADAEDAPLADAAYAEVLAGGAVYTHEEVAERCGLKPPEFASEEKDMNDEVPLREQIAKGRPLGGYRGDARPEVAKLLATVKAALPELVELRDQCAERADEDGVYRFYHQSFKVYGLQEYTLQIVGVLRSFAPDPTAPLDPYFEENFHARYFLDMLVAYGHELDEPPGLMGYGWAAILSLYGLR